MKGHVGMAALSIMGKQGKEAGQKQMTKKAGRKNPRETDGVFLAPATVSAPVKTGLFLRCFGISGVFYY